MTTALEILDSAVKIGLGALVTAIAGWAAAAAARRHELRKTAAEDSRGLLRSAANLLEQATAAANLATYAFAHVPDRKADSAKHLVDAINKLNEARSLAVLSGARELAAEIAKLRGAHEALCGYFLATGDNYSIPRANELIAQLNESWPRIYAGLETAYRGTHGGA